MDGIYFDKSSGLWYVLAAGVKYDGFLTFSEAEKWLKE